MTAYSPEYQRAIDDITTTYIMRELIAGRDVRYGDGSSDVIDASAIAYEVNPEELAAAFAAFRSGDAIEAGRMLAVAWSSALGRVANLHAGLVVEYRRRAA